MNYVNIEGLTLKEVIDHIQEVSPNSMTAYVIIGGSAVPISVSTLCKDIQLVER